MKSICNFYPTRSSHKRIETVRFVYETEIEKLAQPFAREMFTLSLAMSGSARLKCQNCDTSLARGDLFIIGRGIEYTITDYEGFNYIYIHFDGEAAEEILADLGVSSNAPVVRGLEELCVFFDGAVRRAGFCSTPYFCEAALFYAFAMISDKLRPNGKGARKGNLFEAITDYISRRSSEPELSLSELASHFCYSENYISSLIKKNLGMGFSEYLSEIRIRKAIGIMKKGGGRVAQIALECGFSDPLYFSKVFKRATGKTPSEYIKDLERDPISELIRRYVYDES